MTGPIDTALFLALVCGLLLGLVVGLAAGLWLGERGRRQDAQRREVTGSPLMARATVKPAEPGPEERVENLGYSPKTIERGVKALMHEAKQAGRPLSYQDAESQVKQMLSLDYTPPEDPQGIPL